MLMCSEVESVWKTDTGSLVGRIYTKQVVYSVFLTLAYSQLLQMKLHSHI